MARDGKHFFMYFLAIWISSFEKVLLPTSSLVHSFWGSLVFELPVYSGYQSFVWCIASKYFLPLRGWSLQFRDHLFCCAEAFKFYLIQFACLSLSCWSAGGLLRKSFHIPIASRIVPALFCTNFGVSGLILGSLIHFELILVQGDKHGSSFSFFQADNHFSQQHLLKRLSFFYRMFLVTLSKIRWA
jgi:hypothetical protein